MSTTIRKYFSLIETICIILVISAVARVQYFRVMRPRLSGESFELCGKSFSGLVRSDGAGVRLYCPYCKHQPLFTCLYTVLSVIHTLSQIRPTLFPKMFIKKHKRTFLSC